MRESVWHSLKRGGLHIALVAMMLRALLPAGWMPMGDVSAPLVVCTTAGAVTHDQTPHHDPAAVKDHGVCPFASLTTAAPPQGFIALPAPSESAAADISILPEDLSSSPPRFSLSTPRAPPTLV